MPSRHGALAARGSGVRSPGGRTARLRITGFLLEAILPLETNAGVIWSGARGNCNDNDRSDH